jgi:hypothetical protein
MGYRWQEDEEVRNLFYDRLWSMLEGVNGSVSRIGNREIANIIYGMGEVGVDWQRVPKKLKERLLSELYSLLSVPCLTSDESLCGSLMLVGYRNS